MEEKLKRIQEAKEFAKRALEKYGNLIKSIVMMGSVVRGDFKPESDIDIIVIIDDTIEELTPEKLDSIDDDLEKIAKSITDKLSIQPSYTLTEFVDYAKSGHPIVYNFIKEGEPLYDAGFFMPWKRLLKLGKIQGTREAIESYMEDAPKKLA
ncbi:MAG: nucleotidyltransferase domain-containing protein, partial [Candidatus Aenigmatarchaeota archaeon]